MAISSGRNFASCYMELCKVQHLRPLPVIYMTLPHSLDFTTDRIKMDEWGPILNSLSLDRSLKSIGIRSRYQCHKPLEEVNTEAKARAINNKLPVVLTRYLLEWLSHSIGQCVKNSTNLTELELDGIPFPIDCLAVLCVGLSNTRTLNHLSLQRCFIGDAGCELICRTVADAHSIRSLNLSFCGLTFKSGSALAGALSRQKLLLYHDTWKDSLRYREPNLEAMPGLRRLTLNENPQLGDTAALELIEAVKDSLWLKALDLQHCGLSNRIGNEILTLLDHNKTLVVLDIKQNPGVNEEMVKEVVRKLEENNAQGKGEYRWFGPSGKDQRTASADTRKRTEPMESRKTMTRPCSAISVYSKKVNEKLPPRRPVVPTPRRPKRIKIKPPIPPRYVRESQPRAPQKEETTQKLPSHPKISLHLDLQTHIQRVTKSTTKFRGNSRDSMNVDVQQELEAESLGSTGSEKVDVATQSGDGLELIDPAKLQIMLTQLAQSRINYEHLLEESRRSEMMLTSERQRRERAEMDLQATQENLEKLEDVLRDKENEMKGSILLSQQTLAEICSSFDNLVQVLESVARNPVLDRKESREAIIIGADIKRRVASMIRKTKSENLRRGYVLEYDEEVESPTYFDMLGKYAKSEGDVRSGPAPVKLRVERNIGDNPDVANSPTEIRTYRHQDIEKTPMTPSERARAIFESIISGEAAFDLSSKMN